MEHQFVVNDGRELSLRNSEVAAVEKHGWTLTVILRSGRGIEFQFADEEKSDEKVRDRGITWAGHCSHEINSGQKFKGILSWEVDSYRFI